MGFRSNPLEGSESEEIGDRSEKGPMFRRQEGVVEKKGAMYREGVGIATVRCRFCYQAVSW